MITVSVTLHLHLSDYRVADLFVMIGALLQQNRMATISGMQKF
jgi:hypothetical protein